MNGGVRVAAFAALLALIFAAAVLAGHALHPSTGPAHTAGAGHVTGTMAP
jgi:hypothetical protein